MGWFDNYSETEESLRTSGIFDPSIDTYEDVALNAFDISALDYDAPGMEGWKNRAIGLQGFINPLTWIGTFAGQLERESIRAQAAGEDFGLGNVFAAGGKTLWEVGLEGFLMGGIGSVERAATSVGISGLAIVDALADWRETGEFTPVFENFDDFADSWDLSKTKNLDLGELTVLTNLTALTAATGIEREFMANALGHLPFTDPIKWLKSDFDPLNPEDVLLFNEANQLNAVTGVANFIGWVITDPFTWLTGGASALIKVPLTASYKYSYGWSKGVKTKNMVKDENEFLKIMNNTGEPVNSQINTYVDAMVKNNALQNEMLLRGFGGTGQDSKLLSFLLGQADSKEKVATIMLAVSYGNKNARANMKALFRNDPDSMLAIDDMFTGGTGTKQFVRDPDIIERTPLIDETLPQNAERVQIGKEYAAKHEPMMDEFFAAYESLIYKTAEGGAASAEIFTSNILKRSFRSTGLYAEGLGLKNLYTKGKINFARFRADVITNDPGRVGVLFTDNVLKRTLIKWYRKTTLTSTRGAINFNDTGNALSDKFYSLLNEANNATNNSLRNTIDKTTGQSEFDTLLNKYQRATTTQELKEIFDEVQIMAVRKLAAQNKISSRLLADPVEWETFIERFYGGLRAGQDDLTAKQLREGQWTELATARTLEKEVFTEVAPENANWYQTLNLEELGKYFETYVNKRGIPSKLETGAKLGEDFVRQFNSLWSAGVLLRPARFLRERFANGLGVMLSGLAPELWLNGQNFKSMKYLFSNMKNNSAAWRFSTAGRQARQEMFDVDPQGNVKPRGSLNKNVQAQGEVLTRMNKDIKDLETELNDLTETSFEVENMTEQARVNAEYAEAVKDADTRYYGSDEAFDIENIDEDRLLPTVRTSDQAYDYSNDFGTPIQEPIVKQDFELGVQEYNAKINDLNKKIEELKEVKDTLNINSVNDLQKNIESVRNGITSLRELIDNFKKQRVISSKTGKTITVNGRRASSLLGSKEYANNILKNIKSNEMIWARTADGDWFEVSRKEFGSFDKKKLDTLEIKILNKDEFNESLFNKSKTIEQPEPQVVLPYGQEVINTLKPNESIALISKTGEITFVSPQQLANKSVNYFKNYKVVKYTKTKFNNFVEKNGRVITPVDTKVVPAETVAKPIPEAFQPKPAPARKPRGERFANQITNSMTDDEVILIRTKVEKGSKEQYRLISRKKFNRLSNETISNSDVRIVKKNVFENGVKSTVGSDFKPPKPTVKLKYGEQILKGIRGDRQIWIRKGKNKNYERVSREEFAKYSKDDLKNVEIKTTSKPVEKSIISSANNYEPNVGLTQEEYAKNIERLNTEAEKLDNILDLLLRTDETIKGISQTNSARTIERNAEALKTAKQQVENDFNAYKSQTVVDKRTGKSIFDDTQIPYGSRVLQSVSEDKFIHARVKGTKNFKYVTREDFATWSKQRADKHDIVLADNIKSPQATPVVFTGKKINISNFDELPEEARKVLKVTNQSELNNVVDNESFRDNKEFIRWAEENNFGKIEIKQGKKTIVYTNKNFVVSPKRDVLLENSKKRVEKNVDVMYQKHLEKLDADPIYRNRKELIEKDSEVRDYLEYLRTQRGNIENNEQRMQLIADVKAKLDTAKALRDKVRSRYNNSIDFLDRVKKGKQTRFKGRETFVSRDGNTYELANILEGDAGEITEKMLYANSVQGDIIAGVDPSIYRGGVYGIDHYDVNVINPEDPDYHAYYAGYLKYFARNDGAFIKTAESLADLRLGTGTVEYTDEALVGLRNDLVSWLKNTPEGRKYAVDNRIGRKYTRATQTGVEPGAYQTYEDFADSMIVHVDNELYDDDMLQLFLRKNELGELDEINEQNVRDALRNKELLPIKGREAVGAIGNRGIMRSVNKTIAAANKFLVEQPQTYLENIPMAQKYYIDNFKSAVNANEAALGRKLNVDELSALQVEARKYSVEETRKWLYNVQSKWNITEGLGVLIPFLTAITFTSKMMYRAAKENPEGLLWTLGVGTKIMGEFAYADRDGNPVSISEAIKPDSSSYLILSLPEPVRDAFAKIPAIGKAFENGKELRVSMRSLNVWYGQEWIPGPGPIVAVPVAGLINQFPAAAYDTNYVFEAFTGADLVEYFLPFGPQDDLLNMVLPTWIKQVGDLTSAGQQYQDAFAKIMAYEAARYAMFPDEYEAPDEKEINRKVRALFAFKLLSSTSLLASTSITTEVDFYRQKHRQLIDLVGKQQADWVFMTKYPEFMGVTISTRDNQYSLNPNVETFMKLDSMPQVVEIFEYGGDGAKDMLGWAVNPSGLGRYEDYFWDYLTTQSPSPGSTAYRRILSPEEIRRKAESAAAWATFNKFHGALDAYATENNVAWKDDKKASAYRAQFIKELSAQYPTWASEYKSSNFNRFNERADALELLLTEPEWLRTAPVDVSVFKSFVEMRAYIKNDLAAQGLTLASSKGHKKMYEDFILQLKKESLEFSTFYNRFFEDDTLN